VIFWRNTDIILHHSMQAIELITGSVSRDNAEWTAPGEEYENEVPK
jgi:hypothetical protein